MTGQDGFELVVFDCDGVLVDSEVIAIRVDQRVLADLGWELELNDIDGAGGVTLKTGPPAVEEPMSITMNAEGITLTNMVASILVNPELSKIAVGEVTITITEETGVSVSVAENNVLISPESIELVSGTATISMLEELIEIMVDAGTITVTPEMVLVNEGALSIL